MKSIKIVTLATTLFLAGNSLFAQTADEIIQKHIDAVGGKKNWDKVKSIKLTGSVNQGGMEASMSETIINDKGMRMDISAMGQSGYMICTKTEGWMYFPFAGQTSPQTLPADQVKMSQDRLNFNNLQLVNKSIIAKSSLEGKDTIDNVACYKLKVTDNQGNEQTCFIDGSTYYLVRTENKIKMQDEETEIAINYKDFKKQAEGITIPMTISSPQGDLSFKTVEINKATDEKIFKPDTK